jgi:hypothetical protein
MHEGLNSPCEDLLTSPGASGGTTRVGDTLRRSPDRAPAGMRLVLSHLETVGFEGAPRILGSDEFGRCVLTYIPGDVALPPYQAWVGSEDTLASVALLMRRYHEAVGSLQVAEDFLWPTVPPPGFEGNIVGHMDVSLANVVCRDKVAVALIDFELVGLVAPVWDVVRAARHWVPLIDPVDLTGALVHVAGRQVERLGLFADEYQLAAADRARFVDAVLLQADVTYDHMRRNAAAGQAGYLHEWNSGWGMRNRRAKAWVEANRFQLERSLAG